MSLIIDVFMKCYDAIRSGKLIQRESRRDKEYHFQDWFRERLKEIGEPFDEPERNSYPDFRMVAHTIGFEIKGLQYPGRMMTFDCNSQVPSGFHNGREIIYVFGRYPSDPQNPNQYPVLDLILCHGDFLNADHDYVHKNKSIKGFGSYGDIMIRDRKMYVAPTPFALTDGTEAQITLIVPESFSLTKSIVKVADLTRIEAQDLIIGYEFNLTTNTISAKTTPNPSAGQIHKFIACRVKNELGTPVSMASH
ncbi:hypothetical protein U27_02419 [Candidatus Vecturithrix granuli]|uniref:Uncharacterized protein n=1 Tax=Vecturithrix granuli TaxID=1499967 RepID=A0A0S6WB76_VECG1|nr:hypothetical protein U27_02419 [Candidatus Vecturithrix granuli]